MTLRAIVGLALFNVALGLVGTALLWGIRGWRSWSELVRLAGIAYLLGVAASMVVLTAEVVFGIPIKAPTVLANAIALIAAGVALGVRLGRVPRRLRPIRLRPPGLSLFAALFVAGLVVYLEALFRSGRLAGLANEWDGWAFWVPKAQAIYYTGGLDSAFVSDLAGASAAYPPGLPALHALAFHAMGSADVVTLHLQYWFYAVGFVAAVVGLLAHRVHAAILFPMLLAVVLMPSFLARVTVAYADVPLGYLVATAAVALVLWVEERQAWHLAAATLLLGGALVTKREGLALVACVVVAGFAASAMDWRRAWPRLGIAAACLFVIALPWRVWLVANGVSDGPPGGYLGAFHNLDRVRPALDLAVDSFFERGNWAFVPAVALAALVLALVAGALRAAIFASVFLITGLGFSTFVTWSDPALPFTQEDRVNPVIRLTGTLVLGAGVLTPLLLARAWASVGLDMRSTSPDRPSAPDALVWRTPWGWGIVLAAALAYPGSMLLGYSGQTLPGGMPSFPGSERCSTADASGGGMRVVVGVASSYPAARTLRERAISAGLASTQFVRDDCGKVQVVVGGLPSVAASQEVIRRAQAAGLDAAVQRGSDG